MKVACDDPDERPADAALIDALLGGLALKSTTSAFALLEELATRSATLPLVVPRVHAILLAVRSLIESAAIQQQQQQKSQQRRVDDALLDATRALLVRLAPLVTAPLVAGLFEQMLLLGRVASPNSAAAVAIDDATLARLVERMPQTTLLAAPAIEQALRVGGPLTRGALARFAPQLLVADRNVTVRVAALQELARRPQLVMALDDIALRLGDAVLVACSDQRTRTASTTRAAVLRGDEHAVSDAQRDADSALIADVDLLTTAAPLLAMLGTARPSRWLASSLALLVRAAHCTALIDARSRASSDVLTSLDRLAQGLAQGVARTADGLHVARSLDGDVVKAAAALSESWRALLAGTLTVPASMSTTTTTTTTTTLTAVATKETAKTPDASQFLDKQVVASERATIAFVPPQSVVIDIPQPQPPTSQDVSSQAALSESMFPRAPDEPPQQSSSLLDDGALTALAAWSSSSTTTTTTSAQGRVAMLADQR